MCAVHSVWRHRICRGVCLVDTCRWQPACTPNIFFSRAGILPFSPAAVVGRPAWRLPHVPLVVQCSEAPPEALCPTVPIPCSTQQLRVWLRRVSRLYRRVSLWWKQRHFCSVSTRLCLSFLPCCGVACLPSLQEVWLSLQPAEKVFHTQASSSSQEPSTGIL